VASVARDESSPGAATDTAGASDAILQVVGVEKSFVRKARGKAQTLRVLDGVSFDAAAGSFITIIGPSGCGKTTLLNAIAGLTDYDGGTIRLDGAEIKGPGLDRSVVFQHASLLPWRTVARNVAYGLELRRELGKAEIKERVAYAIALVGLAGFEDHYPHEISGGMQQRANLARALAADPKLILMDEPFGALDALTKETLQGELSTLVERTAQTIVFITHDIQEAAYLGDRVLVMVANPGRFVADITVPFGRPRSRDVTETPEFARLVHELRVLLLDAPSTPVGS
jgi:NitT/TauT family transport system ATP-binding protein